MPRTRRKVRQKKEAMDIDITSLLDILVILLVFLLKSYNPAELKVNLVDELTLPSGLTNTLGKKHQQVQVDKSGTVYIDNKQIGNIFNDKALSGAFEGELAEAPKDAKGALNLFIHEDLAYENVEKLMAMASNKGYGNFKFIFQRGGN